MNYHPDLPETGYMTAKAVKQRYAISNSTLYLWLSQGRLCRPYRVGGRAVRFRVEDLRAFEAQFLARDERVTQ